MRKHVLVFGILAGVVIAVLQFVEYRWLVVEHSVEIYGGIVAAIFAAVGIWLGQKLTRRREVVREVPVEVRVEVPARANFVLDQAKLDVIGITR